MHVTVYDYRFFEFINASREAEGRRRSGAFNLVARFLRMKPLAILLAVCEFVVGMILALPIPVYSTLV